jgi:hypothetical protein
MTPVMGAQLSLPSINVPTVANVTLAGLDSPISELLGSVILGGQLLLNAGPENAADPEAWGPSAFGTFTGPVFNPYPFADAITGGLVAQGLYLGGPGFDNGVGVLPQIIDDALPIIRQLGINGSDYLNVTVAALSAAGVALSEGVWNAAGDLLTLDIPGALATLANSISAAGTLALGAGAYVLSNVVNRAQAVLEVLTGNGGLLIEAVVAQIGTVLQKVGQVVDDTVSASTFEGGWNAAIDGIFGATGIPGTVLNVTVGAGQVVNPATVDQAFVPSTRTLVRGLVVGVSDALATTLPPPVAATAAAEAPAAPAALAASAASARAGAVEAAPAAEAPAADSSEAAPAAEAAEAPAAEVAAPKPARKAARAVRASA